MNPVVIGKNIRRRRIIKGLSVEMLAERLGIAPQQLKLFEIGTHTPDNNQLIAMASILKCSIELLCPDVE